MTSWVRYCLEKANVARGLGDDVTADAWMRLMEATDGVDRVSHDRAGRPADLVRADRDGLEQFPRESEA